MQKEEWKEAYGILDVLFKTGYKREAVRLLFVICFYEKNTYS
jgi:hypothetical protein